MIFPLTLPTGGTLGRPATAKTSTDDGVGFKNRERSDVLAAVGAIEAPETTNISGQADRKWTLRMSSVSFSS